MISAKLLGPSENDTTCWGLVLGSGKYYFEAWAHVPSKARPYRHKEEHNVQQKGSVSLIVRCINPNQLRDGILERKGGQRERHGEERERER